MVVSEESVFPTDYVPRIHRAEVLEVSLLGPGMARVRFGGADLADHPTTGIGDEYVRMFFPDSPTEDVRIPHITSMRGWAYPEGVEASHMRVYTIRAHERGNVLVDFVLHDGGVAAEWVRSAQPGMSVGINPPCGLYERPSHLKTQILVADEPGLPAALRLAEETAADVETTLVLEARDVDHRLTADVPGVRYVWSEASGNGHGNSGVLDALRTLAPDADTYVWVSTEGGSNRAIRRYLRHEQGLPAENYKCVAYWQQRAEQRQSRMDALGEPFQRRLRDLRNDATRDPEAVDDDIATLFDEAGL